MVNKTAKTIKKPTSKKSVAAKKTSAKSKKTVVRKVSAKKPTAANISAANSSSQINKTTAKRNYFRCFTAEFWRNALDIAAKHSKTAAFLLGALLTAALPPFYFTLALFIAFSGAMFLACKAENLRTLAAIGYWFGFGYFAVGFYWIGNALLVDIAQTGWLYPIVLLLNGAFFGLFTILPFMAAKIGRGVIAKSIILAAVWCLICEWLRSFILTGFPWNPISSVLTFSPELMQILSVFGTYGTSLILILLASLPAIWLLDFNKKKFLTCGGFVLCSWLGIWIYGGYIVENRPQIPDGHSLIVRLVQPSIAQTVKWKPETLEQNLQTYIDLSLQEDNSYVDFTIWGETASPFDLFYDSFHARRVSTAVPRYGYLITGTLRLEFNASGFTPYNSMAVMNPKGEVVAWYDKNHLVPFGEYIPLRRFLPSWVRPLTNVVAQFGRGEKYKTLQVGVFPAFIPLICYEIIFSDEIMQKSPDLAAENSSVKPTWAVVLTNDGWYGLSAGPYQHLAAAQMRAVEEGITIVRSANSGISAVINPYGMIVAQIGLAKRGFIDVKVKPQEARQTIFGKYGNKIPLALSLGLILLVMLKNILFRRR